MGTVLDFRMQAALLACARTSDLTFCEIATGHGVDREELQEHWFDHLNRERGIPSLAFSESRRHDAHQSA
jgi:hypothetical protein